MRIYYRISEGSYKKDRLSGATKIGCLKNFVENFYQEGVDKLHIFYDNVSDKLKEDCHRVMQQSLSVDENSIQYHDMNQGSSAGSFRVVFATALRVPQTVWSTYPYVYFVEDDYVHLPGSRQVMLEGLERANYVTLYNHPDKYIPAKMGGNPFVDDAGASVAKIFVTPNSYWMTTNSTTMTFATRVQTLYEDQEIWNKYIQGAHPHDMQIFLELGQTKGRSVIQPIPTKATHADIAWASHLHGTGITDWNEVL